MVQQVWLVTGCSTGFGEQFVKTILQRGDKAIATARKIDSIQHLADLGASTLQLDVTASQAELDEKIKQAIPFYGHINVVVHNAGYGELGALEDLTQDALLRQYAVNVFGVANLTRSIMPHFRAQHSGHFVLISSVGAWVGMPGMGAYPSSKAAVEGLMRSFDMEARPLGIKTLILQPGSFRTNMQNPRKFTDAPESAHYQALMDGYVTFSEKVHGKIDGDVAKFAGIAVDLVKGEGCAEGKEVPLSMPVGPDAFAYVKGRLELEMKTLGDWEGVISSTNFDEGVEVMGAEETAAAAPWAN